MKVYLQSVPIFVLQPFPGYETLVEEEVDLSPGAAELIRDSMRVFAQSQLILNRMVEKISPEASRSKDDGGDGARDDGDDHADDDGPIPTVKA